MIFRDHDAAAKRARLRRCENARRNEASKHRGCRYAKQKEEFMKNALFEEFTAAERDKILRHRRRKQEAERKAEAEHKARASTTSFVLL